MILKAGDSRNLGKRGSLVILRRGAPSDSPGAGRAFSVILEEEFGDCGW